MIAIDRSIIPSGRVIYAGTGPVTRDQDDVRAYGKTAEKAMKMLGFHITDVICQLKVFGVLY